jgi:ATP-dependent DNA helicase RecG
VLGAAQAGRQSSLRLLRLLPDEDLIGQARTEATAVVSADRSLAGHPALRAAIEELFGVQAEYLDKT